MTLFFYMVLRSIDWGFGLTRIKGQILVRRSHLRPNNLTFFYVTGPLSAYLVEKFGVRRLAVAATVLHVIGLISSAFATRIWHVIATFSLLSGIYLLYR